MNLDNTIRGIWARTDQACINVMKESGGLPPSSNSSIASSSLNKEHKVNYIPEHRVNPIPGHMANYIPEHRVNCIPEHKKNPESHLKQWIYGPARLSDLYTDHLKHQIDTEEDDNISLRSIWTPTINDELASKSNHEEKKTNPLQIPKKATSDKIIFSTDSSCDTLSSSSESELSNNYGSDEPRDEWNVETFGKISGVPKALSPNKSEKNRSLVGGIVAQQLLLEDKVPEMESRMGVTQIKELGHGEVQNCEVSHIVRNTESGKMTTEGFCQNISHNRTQPRHNARVISRDCRRRRRPRKNANKIQSSKPSHLSVNHNDAFNVNQEKLTNEGVRSYSSRVRKYTSGIEETISIETRELICKKGDVNSYRSQKKIYVKGKKVENINKPPQKLEAKWNNNICNFTEVEKKQNAPSNCLAAYKVPQNSPINHFYNLDLKPEECKRYSHNVNSSKAKTYNGHDSRDQRSQRNRVECSRQKLETNYSKNEDHQTSVNGPCQQDVEKCFQLSNSPKTTQKCVPIWKEDLTDKSTFENHNRCPMPFPNYDSRTIIKEIPKQKSRIYIKQASNTQKSPETQPEHSVLLENSASFYGRGKLSTGALNAKSIDASQPDATAKLPKSIDVSQPDATAKLPIMKSSESNKDRESKKSAIIRDGKEMADFIVGCHTGLEVLKAFFDDWELLRLQSIDFLNKIEETIKLSGKGRVRDLIMGVSATANLVSLTPHPVVSLGAKITAALTGIAAKLLHSEYKRKDAEEKLFEIREIFQKDIEASSLVYLYGVQCDSQFQETCRIINEFYQKIQSENCHTLMSDSDIREFLGGILRYNPMNLSIFYTRLQLYYEKLIRSSKSEESDGFIRVFEDMPLAVQTIHLLPWRFDTESFDNSIVQTAWDELFEFFNDKESTDIDSFSRKIQNCLYFLKKEQRILERAVLNLSK